MLRTIDRYVIREVVPPFVLSLLIFTFVLELPPVMQELERLLAKGVPWPTVGRIILLLSPQALGLTIPMALLVGLLIGLGRLSTDREAVALLACGVSPYRLLRPVLTLAGVATAATLYVMIAAIPDANQKYREILFATLSKKVESDVKPRVFFQDFPNWVLYPRNDAEPGQPGWNDVMLANTLKPEAVEVHMARHGRIVLDPAKRTVELILSDGTKYATVGSWRVQHRSLQADHHPPRSGFGLSTHRSRPRVDGKNDRPTEGRYRRQNPAKRVDAQRSHGDPRQVLHSRGVPGLRGNRPGPRVARRRAMASSVALSSALASSSPTTSRCSSPNRWPRATGFRLSTRAGCRTSCLGPSASWRSSGGPGMRRVDFPSECVFRNGANPRGSPR